MNNACEETKSLSFNPSATLRPRQNFSGGVSDLLLILPIVVAIVEIGAAAWLLGLILHISPVADSTTVAEPNILPFKNVEPTLAASH